MQIQNVLLTEEDLKQAIAEFLQKRGVQVNVAEFKKAYGFDKKGFDYEAVITLPDDETKPDPQPPEAA